MGCSTVAHGASICAAATRSRDPRAFAPARRRTRSTSPTGASATTIGYIQSESEVLFASTPRIGRRHRIFREQRIGGLDVALDDRRSNVLIGVQGPRAQAVLQSRAAPARPAGTRSWRPRLGHRALARAGTREDGFEIMLDASPRKRLERVAGDPDVGVRSGRTRHAAHQLSRCTGTTST